MAKYQSFRQTSDPAQGPARLAALRAQMQAEGMDAFLVPRADIHQGEYVAPHDARLAWLTGFTGSAGFCIALQDRAGVFVDGRYRVQVKVQTADCITPVDWPETKAADWIVDHLPSGSVVGVDPWLHSMDEITALQKTLGPKGITLRAVDNLVDRIWPDQPAPPMAPIHPHPIEFAGQAAADKCATCADSITAAGAACAVLTLPDAIAWALNIRGADVPHMPAPHALAVLHASGAVQLYVHPDKTNDALRNHLGPFVSLHHSDDFPAALLDLPGPVMLDPSHAPFAIKQALDLAGISTIHASDPTQLPKACKNAIEIAGARAAHLRDGAAMVTFLHWLDQQPGGSITEIDVVDRLESARIATGELRDISFETIAGSGPNGAIIHYRVDEGSNRSLQNGDLLVLDSGGQYLDGTTDITRTIAIGTPPADAIRAFTAVLCGMIDISRLRFARGIAGAHIDAIARAPLWQLGLDYGHGTGHGVGSYLSVHEGPQRISRISQVPLQPGMILSNEPGYYREGAFGIRIENLIAVTPSQMDEFLEFETLTLAPIDRRLIDPTQMSAAQQAWLNAYHARVYDALSNGLDADTQAWLKSATAPI